MNPIQIKPQSPVFKDAPNVLKDTKTLLRIASLNSSIWEDDERGDYLKELQQIWVNSKSMLATSSLDEAKEYLTNKFHKLDLIDVYGPKIEAAQTPEKLEHYIEKFSLDVNSVLSNPLKKSTRGNKGPTFLVSFPRQNKSGITELQCYVMKWTHWNELCCTRIYHAFSRFLSQHCNSPFFSVPDVCGFDFEENVHETGDSRRITMETKDQKGLNATFQQIAKIGAPKHPMNDKLVMLCERINGENLFDFATSKYAHLELSQKMKLLTQLGQIAMLDLITGNLDRIVQINFDTHQDCYGLLDCEANFGNIMVQWATDSGKEPTLFAIDNGIEDALVENPTRIEKYQEFLNALLSDPEMERKLVENIVASFKHAIATQVDDISGANRKIVRQKLEGFSEDIEAFGRECFLAGLKEMDTLLQTTLLPLWNGVEGSPMREYLSTTYSKLLEAVQFRFNEFTQKRTP